MLTEDFKAKADAIEALFDTETSDAKSAFEQATADAKARRQQRMAELAEEFRKSLSEANPGEETTGVDLEKETTPELPLSKTGRIQRGVLPEILRAIIEQEFQDNFTKTELFRATLERYPNSPIKRGSIIGTVNRFHEQGFLELVSEEPEQTYRSVSDAADKEDMTSSVSLARFRNLARREEMQ